jgi:hypothetical protein
MREAFLSVFDKDCLRLTIGELRLKYPRVPVHELEDGQRIIREQMTELNQRRFLRWLSVRKWVLYSYGED